MTHRGMGIQTVSRKSGLDETAVARAGLHSKCNFFFGNLWTPDAQVFVAACHKA